MKQKKYGLKFFFLLCLITLIGILFISISGYKYSQSIENYQKEMLLEWSIGDVNKKRLVNIYFDKCRFNKEIINKNLSIYECAEKYTNDELAYVLKTSVKMVEKPTFFKPITKPPV